MSLDKEALKDIFRFSNKERLGLLSLSVIAIVGLLFLQFGSRLFPMEFKDAAQKEERLRAQLAALDSLDKKENTQISAKVNEKSKLFNFDPNSLDKEGYIALGFTAKQAASIHRYFEKGGRIYKVEDFKKLYVVDEEVYQRLAPYIQIKSSFSVSSSENHLLDTAAKEFIDPRKEPVLAQIHLLDINRADSISLLALPGIGPIYAQRIIRYRRKLGGFVHLDQLQEVYGLKDRPETVAMIQERVQLGDLTPQRIVLNSVEWKELVQHPYIDRKLANSILAMRKVRGSFQSVEEVQESHLLDSAHFTKLRPYLELND